MRALRPVGVATLFALAIVVVIVSILLFVAQLSAATPHGPVPTAVILQLPDDRPLGER